MSDTTNRISNTLKLLIFCAPLGATAGTVIWIFLKVFTVGTDLIWKVLPGSITAIPYWVYTIAVCTLGGIIIGLYRRKFGDYP